MFKYSDNVCPIIQSPLKCGRFWEYGRLNIVIVNTEPVKYEIPISNLPIGGYK